YPAPPTNSCACNECPHMKLNTMEKLYLCLKHNLPEVTLEQDVIDKGRPCIDKMLDISAKAGL
ncbi:MAG: quinolinate synthase NadA, partial [Aureispira sp.]|nr:quinolinate synthase NadA [Aureispira sp.]